ncbi:MAG: hypothetical protein GKS06_14230 [Acidobacteria bacterium]|nr:hypothetical protein [Acidobacteriota bacterium]
MFELLAILTPIALLDAGSIVPVAVVPMAIFLASRAPYRTSLGYAAGVFLPYVGFGVVIAFGLDWLLDAAGVWFSGFYSDPRTEELVLQVAIGLAALWFGARMVREPGQSESAEPSTEVSPSDAFGLGAVTVLVGLPGAVPYFAAIDQVLRAGLPAGENVVAIVYYNAIIVAPLGLMVILFALLGERSRPVFERVAAFLMRWSPRGFAVLLLLLGIVLVVDGIGFLVFDAPLLPVGTETDGSSR